MSTSNGFVVVGVDGSEGGLAAVDLAAREASLRGRRLRDETLIDLDSEPGAALPDDDRTGFGGWVDELVADDSPPREEAP